MTLNFLQRLFVGVFNEIWMDRNGLKPTHFNQRVSMKGLCVGGGLEGGKGTAQPPGNSAFTSSSMPWPLVAIVSQIGRPVLISNNSRASFASPA